MPTLLQSYGVGLSGADAFTSGAGNPNDQSEVQPWPLGQLLWGQFELDDVLPDYVGVIDFSSISASPEAVRLRRNLHSHGQSCGTTADAAPRRMSILDFPSLNLGTMLRPLSPDDDLLGEMLDEAY